MQAEVLVIQADAYHQPIFLIIQASDSSLHPIDGYMRNRCVKRDPTDAAEGDFDRTVVTEPSDRGIPVILQVFVTM